MNIQQLQAQLERYLVYLDQDQKNPHLLLNVSLLNAQILHHQQHIMDAIHLLEPLIFAHETNAELAGLLSLLYFDNHDIINAELFAQKAISLDPNVYNAKLVQLLLATLRKTVSLDDIQSLLKINAVDARLWFILGTTQMHQMNITAAEDAFVQATTLHPTFFDAWICAGWCQLLQNHLDKAHNSYQQAINIDTTSADGWAGVSLVRALQNNMSESNQYLQHADTLDPSCFLAAISRIIVANQSNPNIAAKQFNATFPDITEEIHRLLTEAILRIAPTSNVIH